MSHLPETIIEPTCGRGSIVRAALEEQPQARVIGIELQSQHVQELRNSGISDERMQVFEADYFQFDWEALIDEVAKPLWIVGNPPWVTNSFLMGAGSTNLPAKSPQADLRGIEAQTGKSNFDISESMIRDWFQWAAGCNGTLAVICKQSVARKVLLWWWKRDAAAPAARIHLIDAKEHFGANVSACVLVCSFAIRGHEKVCDVYPNTDAELSESSFGYVDGFVVADVPAYKEGRPFLGTSQPRWRSGIKHDAAFALELERVAGRLRTKAGDEVDVDTTNLFPLRKGSDLRKSNSDRFLIVPNTDLSKSHDELVLSIGARTLVHLQRNREVFSRRKSSIYRKGGDFSIFGVGPYTFLPWKVAIGALYKSLDFVLIGPREDKPVVFDDTVYFLSFETESEAKAALSKLESESVQRFLRSMIFWDDMRPVKTDILNRVDLSKVV